LVASYASGPCRAILRPDRTGSVPLDKTKNMLRNWFKSKRSIQLASVRDGTADLERFIVALKGMSAEELGTVVALAAILRMELRAQGLFPDDALDIASQLPESEQKAVRSGMSGLTLDFQKKNHPSAGAAMVWLHTLRALQFPELRLLGRQMWGQLQRGFPHVFDAFRFFEGTVGQPLPLGALQASQFIPVGLEPFER
jgi:hypothetical protein